MKTKGRIASFGLAGVLACAVILLASSDVSAGGYHHGGHGGYFKPGCGTVYGGYGCYRPSLHYDSVYHADYYHWTPSGGFHSHGHYDSVPHYTGGYGCHRW